LSRFYISRVIKHAATSLCAVALLLPALAHAGSPSFLPGRILISPKPELTAQALQAILAVHGAKKVDEIAQLRVHVLSVPAANQAKVLDALKHNPNIEFAEPDYLAQTSATTANDPYYLSGYEWHLGKIQAPDAWSITTGSASTIVAVVDSGVAPNQPDLAGKLLNGYNFYAGTTNWADDNGHGTAVAGSAAAQGNNGLGVAGVAWNVMILPVKVADSTGYATYSNMAKGLTFAADQGARVINISMAGTSSSSTLQSAVTYAWNHNCLIFAAAGNDATSSLHYPAACNYATAVSATQSDDSLASFSDFGNYIALSAPGVGIWTTNRDGTYGSWSGTSFSAPITAGIAALVLSFNPQLSNAAVLDLLKHNADDLGTAGYDPYFGYGRVNAYRTLLAAGAIPPVTDTTAPSASINNPTGGTLAGSVTIAVSTSDNVGVTKVELYLDNALAATSSAIPASFTWDTTTASNSTHTLKALAYDAAGNVGASSVVTVTVQNAAADTLSPVVAITSPGNNTVVSKTLKVAVNGSDNIGVVREELYLDGAIVARSTTALSTFSLNASKWAKGNHTLQAIAYDAAGNAGISSIVTVVR
jgi:subtilisin family serine protease